jgi:hypothetical protein
MIAVAPSRSSALAAKCSDVGIRAVREFKVSANENPSSGRPKKLATY